MNRTRPQYRFAQRALIAAVVGTLCGAGCMPSGGSSSESIDSNGDTHREATATWPIGHTGAQDPAQMQRDMNEVDATRGK